MTTQEHTIRDAAEIWLKRCRLRGLERATIRSYQGHFDHHIEPKIGDLRLNELKRSQLQEFIDEMLEKNSLAMTKKVLASLKAILAEAVSRDMIEVNLANDIRLPRSRRNEAEKIIPTKAEIKALIEKAPERHKPLIVTAILTGMRASELRGLTWDHIDFENRVIKVRQRADRYNEMGNPKSRAGRRDIPMTPKVCETLLEWRQRCPGGELRLVFPNGAGNVETLSNITNRVFNPLMRKCKITKANSKPKFSFHCLRHAAASLYIEQSWSPKKIQSILGHSSINMTYDVYGHLFHDPSEDVELMAKMEQDLWAA
ncbi:tyrosine-type recombinase/integrase [Sneathiella limimaris]|uniref:tyrosine-type recombinase/integrase n=1 Tax=Sneathiella limimaris TaxID=1964213 RepID=UPI00146D6CA2|nr:site-specific integrase [Sneathiella limimaris]